MKSIEPGMGSEGHHVFLEIATVCPYRHFLNSYMKQTPKVRLKKRKSIKEIMTSVQEFDS